MQFTSCYLRLISKLSEIRLVSIYYPNIQNVNVKMIFGFSLYTMSVIRQVCGQTQTRVKVRTLGNYYSTMNKGIGDRHMT